MNPDPQSACDCAKIAPEYARHAATSVSDESHARSYGSPIEGRAGRGREATMSEAITEHTVLSRDQARIDSTLDWYFNFGAGDVGLQSNHGATVAVLINPKNRGVANADAAEDAMFRAVEAVT
jgi:hypothetical protein